MVGANLCFRNMEVASEQWTEQIFSHIHNECKPNIPPRLVYKLRRLGCALAVGDLA